MDQESIHGSMAENTKEPGKIITCMGRESTPGEMEDAMRVRLDLKIG